MTAVWLVIAAMFIVPPLWKHRVKVWAYLRRPKWLGLPRWLVLGVVVGVALGYVFFGNPVQGPKPLSPKALAAAEGLRTGSVYVAPGAPPVVDVERVRQVIGDRPIVVAMLDSTPLPPARMGLEGQDMCEEIAEIAATNLVITFAMENKDGYDSSYCVGKQFGNAHNGLKNSDFGFSFLVAPEQAWQYRATETNKTPEIEEFVLAFDAKIAEKNVSIPRRAVIQPPAPAPDPVQTRQIVTSLGGIMLASVALFALLHVGALLWRRRADRQSGMDTRRIEIDARISSLSDDVLHPRRPHDAAEAEHQAELARRYVLVLKEFSDRGPVSEVDRELSSLEEMVRR
ncbi:hypothetical protein EV193_106106 [Herbihabitans rhizosphaerae]|uniref:Uncharacterized protein n=1 Tax=Herbihabitans rhizosphaerae TaxID=1872711 RepID=A0A4Q7KNR3_9PSEU|nr:hypothetical protein [Herbihabitans rhizosphaerae]RZS36872.1 hypothetical protein EV193_106106 [Herbihabitans rhizosphaerae]